MIKFYSSFLFWSHLNYYIVIREFNLFYSGVLSKDEHIEFPAKNVDNDTLGTKTSRKIFNI